MTTIETIAEQLGQFTFRLIQAMHEERDVEEFARKDKIAGRSCSALSSLARLSTPRLNTVLPDQLADLVPKEQEDA